MDDSIYGRQDDLGILQDQKVAIIGCGGIGSWISLYLGLAGVKEIDIYDSDSISESNLNRFPLGPDKVGINKANAMAEHIQSLRKDISVIPRQNFDPDIHSDRLKEYRWVIVTTDSLKSRRMIFDEVVKAGKSEYKHIGYIECGADGYHATVTFSPPEFATSEEMNPGYRSVPVFVGPCTLAASIAAYYVLLNTPRDYEKVFQANWTENSEFNFATIDEADTDEWLNDNGAEIIEEDEIVRHVVDNIELVGREVDNEQAI